MSEIKAIIFDCFGVLIGDVLRVKANEVSLTRPEAAEQMYAAMRSGDKGIISRQQVLELFGDALGISADEVASMSMEGEVRNEALLQQIPALRRDYKIGLLSNVESEAWVQDRFGEPLSVYFDAVTVSGEVGIVKPEPEIYRIAAERLGVTPEECVFIDDIERNIDGARAVGMQGIVYRTPEQTMRELAELTS